MTIRHVLLADHPEAAERVAQWYFNQWGRLAGKTMEVTLEQVQNYRNRDRIPLIVVALNEDAVIGAAQLKIREMEQFPDREHWLGGVYIDAAYRGHSVASQLVQHVVVRAHALGVGVLHLQTERLDGGLYARLGWNARERTTSS